MLMCLNPSFEMYKLKILFLGSLSYSNTSMYTYLHASRLIHISILVILITFQIVSSRQDIDKEISELKMSVNTRGRLVATEFLKQFI